jgi:hypothetical protein
VYAPRRIATHPPASTGNADDCAVSATPLRLSDEAPQPAARRVPPLWLDPPPPPSTVSGDELERAATSRDDERRAPRRATSSAAPPPPPPPPPPPLTRASSARSPPRRNAATPHAGRGSLIVRPSLLMDDGFPKQVDRKVRLGWEMNSRSRYATPADFTLQDCSPYRGYTYASKA